VINEILANTFEKHIWARYIKELSFEPSIETLYANALLNLNKHETEKAITYIILTLEADLNFRPAQHLARTMLFGLSEEFLKKKGPAIKEKNRDLNKYLFSLKQSEIKLEKEILVLQNNIAKITAKLNEGFSISSFFKKKENSSQLNACKEQINVLNNELPKIKKEISKISEIAQIEEYTKVIALILEVVMHPRRFSGPMII